MRELLWLMRLRHARKRGPAEFYVPDTVGALMTEDGAHAIMTEGTTPIPLEP